VGAVAPGPGLPAPDPGEQGPDTPMPDIITPNTHQIDNLQSKC
jgi:hypothetical protein